MKEEDWKVILGRIKAGKCTPFLGAGVNYGILPLGAQIARELAVKEDFPLRASEDLASVSQFLAVKYKDSQYPKDRVLERLRSAEAPDFTRQDDRLDCLTALAELPFSVYLTTNYDDLILQALAHTTLRKQPRAEICRWHKGLRSIPSVFRAAYTPDLMNPVVFHLHGSLEYPSSLVLTEDDYLDFLVNISKSQKIVPPRIQEALTNTSLLFVGYRLRDIDFRVLYRGLVQSMDGNQRRLSLTVQIHPPEDHAGNPDTAEDFLAKYFGELNVCVYWGTASMFAKELRQRWTAFH